jgi:hypothetical protein
MNIPTIVFIEEGFSQLQAQEESVLAAEMTQFLMLGNVGIEHLKAEARLHAGGSELLLGYLLGLEVARAIAVQGKGL